VEPTLQENVGMSRANLDKDPDEVAAMFDGVAKRYDLSMTCSAWGEPVPGVERQRPRSHRLLG
jgi:hypothetical protein